MRYERISHCWVELEGLVWFFIFIYFFTLQHCIGSAIHWLESAMGVHVFPILNPPSHFPPHPIPLGHPSAPALSTLSHASNLDWWFVSHMIIYMFQCHSPISSHPHPLPQSPKDCSVHLCLFCCLTYGVIVTVFLNSIYMRRYRLSKFHIYALVYCIKKISPEIVKFFWGCKTASGWEPLALYICYNAEIVGLDKRARPNYMLLIWHM